jgi:hypothetical protein
MPDAVRNSVSMRSLSTGALVGMTPRSSFSPACRQVAPAAHTELAAQVMITNDVTIKFDALSISLTLLRAAGLTRPSDLGRFMIALFVKLLCEFRLMVLAAMGRTKKVGATL